MADAMAIGAGAVGAVEGEQPRGELLHHSAVHRAGEVFGIEALPLHTVRQLLIRLGHHFHQRQAIAALEGGAQRIGEPLLDALARHEPVHHHLDVVGVVLVELDVVGQLAHFAVDAHPSEAFRHQAAQQLHVGALLAAHHRREQLIAGALGQLEDLIDHLVDRLGPDRAVALRAVGLTGAAEEQAQIVLNLGDGADRGAGVMAGGFLIDRDRRREPLDRIHIGLVHLPEELPRVRRQALDVTALTFRKDRVKSERTLAAAAHAGEHHQLVAGNGDVDVLEVVLAGTPHPDHILEGTAIQRLQGRFLVHALGEGAGHPGGSGRRSLRAPAGSSPGRDEEATGPETHQGLTALTPGRRRLWAAGRPFS